MKCKWFNLRTSGKTMNISKFSLISKHTSKIYTNDYLIELIKETKKGNIKARNKIILAVLDWLKIVSSRINVCNESQFEDDDLLHEMIEIIMNSIYTYNSTKNMKFVTYITQDILWKIHRKTMHYSTVKIPLVIRNYYLQARKIKRENPNITDEELIKKMNITKHIFEKYKNIITNLKFNKCVSLERDFNDDWAEYINGKDNCAFEQNNQIINQITTKEMLSLIKSERNLDMVKRRFGFDPYYKPQTLQVIGDAHGITREAIRRVINIELKSIRKYYEIKNHILGFKNVEYI